MIKRMIIMLLLVTLVLSGVFGYKMFANMMMKKYMMAGMPPQTVSTIVASLQEWQPKLEAIGTLRAVNGSDLSSEMAGIVQSIDFESGSDVFKDAVLVQLRNDDDLAKLNALLAGEKLAQITYDRDLKQLKAQAISQSTVDSDAATLDSAKAQTKAQQALIDKKTIKAPFAGRLGIRQVDVGQYLQPGMAIVTLQQLDPIYVDFSLPEQSFSKLQAGQKVTLHTDANADTDFTGTITAINTKVDEATRNVMVRATFANPDHKLLPGMFGNVSVNTDQPVKYVTLPQTAIIYNTYGNAVYLIHSKDGNAGDKSNLIAEQSIVMTGPTRGDQVAILSGVKDGDEVVTSGQIKLRNGMTVAINNDVQPSNDANPTPHE